jgi:periplasmic divalent cation tolerance protein
MKVAAHRWLVFVTAPDKKTANRIASELLKEKLAACVSAFPVFSRYRWKGKVESAREVQLFIKTSAPVEKLKKRIFELHPYEVPEILAFEIKKGLPAYLAWMNKESG